ncbi:hypothetical protein GOZ97_16550 [Agrobacterium vitis]|uniref:TnsA endonuclease N-terminal domain-containing protein n=1 Tax=Rhizobium/Agrobacterium group TaxID=227290 RepID=UPI0008DC2101|nr:MULTISPECIES: TnsA endonuclease N-terminal domain-containing protein [Rhizobium/Agrobacterium group]MCF1433200.1 hypothetical protein [Allorhizobium ampelinum]MUO91733.1 hypothetical protein [Agrobacterium vitis]MUZ54766.1 hypothetical protein [Agrobacterium vitis]MUZ93038.1 hypothetical protein [Agrobacterium vitis]MVA41440.1 hypothetical protein [Agrobacterium vitis]
MRKEHYVADRLIRIRCGNTFKFEYSGAPNYHRPSKPLLFKEPQAANGNRVASTKSPFSARGRTVNHGDDRTMFFESNLERRTALILQAHPDIAEVRAQWPTVKWIAADGSRRRHTFDFWVRRTDGISMAVAVKPKKYVEKYGLLPMLARIHGQGAMAMFADDVTVITEDYANQNSEANAKRILLSRRVRNHDEVEIARNVVEQMDGPERFSELFRGANSEAARRIALWCLIDEGCLAASDPSERISDHTIMIRAK